MTDQRTMAYHYEIHIDGVEEKMGILVPIPDEIMKIASMDDIRGQCDAMIPMALEDRLKQDKPEVVGRLWEVTSCTVVDFADYAGAGGQ